MKYIDKFPDVKPIFDEHGGIIRGKTSRPCAVCSELTEFVEVNYEVPLCSEACLNELDKSVELYFLELEEKRGQSL